MSHKYISMIWEIASLQDPISPIIHLLQTFHDSTISTIVLISTYVLITLISTTLTQQSFTTSHENHELETTWTILPGIILIALAFPSLRLLYLLEEARDPAITIKITGHQWYWSYEYADFNQLEFDSFILLDFKPSLLRLLEVDNRIVIPWKEEIRLLVTAADVLHSWAVPNLGIKIDAVPGRLNQISFTPTKPGVSYGQCSEICGTNHSFIPIRVEAVALSSWAKWVSSFVPPSTSTTSNIYTVDPRPKIEIKLLHNPTLAPNEPREGKRATPSPSPTPNEPRDKEKATTGPQENKLITQNILQ